MCSGKMLRSKCNGDRTSVGRVRIGFAEHAMLSLGEGAKEGLDETYGLAFCVTARV